MEEYLRNKLQKYVGEYGKVEIKTWEDPDAMRVRRDCWMLIITISHKDIIWTDWVWLNDLIFGTTSISEDRVVNAFNNYVKAELFKRFYEKEES